MPAEDLLSDIDRFAERLRQVLMSGSRLSFDGYRAHLIGLLQHQKLTRAPPNHHNIVATLPHALLHRLSEFLGPLDRIRLSQTCQHFRQCGLHNPWIRNDLSGALQRIPNGISAPSFTAKLIPRGSPTRLVNLSLAIDMFDVNRRAAAFNIIESVLPQLSLLCLNLSWAIPDGAVEVYNHAINILDGYLASPAPNLRHFYVDVSGGLFSTEYPIPPNALFSLCAAPSPIASTIFNGHAPNLTYCSLRNLSLANENYGAFSRLTTLSYTPTSRHIGPSDLRRILAGCPLLVNLSLDVWYFNQWPQEETLSHPQPHTTLRNLHVYWVDYGCGDLLTCLMHIPMRRLVYSARTYCDDRPSANHWSFLLEMFTVGRLEIGLTTCEAELQHIPTGLPVQLRFRTDLFDCVYDLLRESSTYTAITSLTIHEFYWPWATGIQEAASLTSLRILLASCNDFWSSSTMSCGIFQATAQTAWRIPNLQELQLTYWLSASCTTHDGACCCRHRLTISLSDVLFFLASCLLFTRPCIGKLALTGVEVVDLEPHFWLERLAEMVDDVDFSSTCTPTSADAPRNAWNGRGFQEMFRDNFFDSLAP